MAYSLGHVMRQGAWQEHVLKGSAHIIVARKWGRGFKSRAPQSLLRAHPNDLTPSTRLHLSKFPPPLNSGMPGNRPLINGLWETFSHMSDHWRNRNSSLFHIFLLLCENCYYIFIRLLYFFNSLLMYAFSKCLLSTS